MTTTDWPAIPTPNYARRCRIVVVVDGDTVVVREDKGRRQYEDLTLRLAGINAPELNTPEGDAAANFVRTWTGLDQPQDEREWPLVFLTEKADKFSPRWDAWLFRMADGVLLNRVLVEAGWAKTWSGKGPKP